MKLDYDLIKKYFQYAIKKENFLRTQNEKRIGLKMEQKKQKENLEKMLKKRKRKPRKRI